MNSATDPHTSLGGPRAICLRGPGSSTGSKSPCILKWPAFISGTNPTKMPTGSCLVWKIPCRSQSSVCAKRIGRKVQWGPRSTEGRKAQESTWRGGGHGPWVQGALGSTLVQGPSGPLWFQGPWVHFGSKGHGSTLGPRAVGPLWVQGPWVHFGSKSPQVHFGSKVRGSTGGVVLT